MGRLLDEDDVINALWDLRRSLQMMDNSQKADLILQGVYLSEKKIEQLPSAQLIAFASPDTIQNEKPKFYPEDWKEIL